MKKRQRLKPGVDRWLRIISEIAVVMQILCFSLMLNQVRICSYIDEFRWCEMGYMFAVLACLFGVAAV